jgi:hypothetical protein
MEEIERVVVLPEGAKPLNAYGRNYAYSGKDMVTAIYLLPFPPLNMSEGCEVMLEDFESRPCTDEEIAEIAKSDETAVAAQTPAGERRWYNSSHDLPFINDGGCTQVTVDYDTATRRVLKAACNGHA